MHILAVLLSICILSALMFYGLLALLRQTIGDSPYAAPSASAAEALQATAGGSVPSNAGQVRSKDAERGSCSEGCT
jgi:hypothetical protein